MNTKEVIETYRDVFPLSYAKGRLELILALAKGSEGVRRITYQRDARFWHNVINLHLGREME